MTNQEKLDLLNREIENIFFRVTPHSRIEYQNLFHLYEIRYYVQQDLALENAQKQRAT